MNVPKVWKWKIHQDCCFHHGEMFNSYSCANKWERVSVKSKIQIQDIGTPPPPPPTPPTPPPLPTVADHPGIQHTVKLQ